eukprot:7868735-Pyramimonas_sp.AAC.1
MCIRDRDVGVLRAALRKRCGWRALPNCPSCGVLRLRCTAALWKVLDVQPRAVASRTGGLRCSAPAGREAALEAPLRPGPDGATD